MSKLTISDARVKELEKILSEIEVEQQCPLTMTIYTVEGKSFNISPFSNRNKLLVDAVNDAYAEIAGVYETHEDIKEKLLALQEQEKQNKLADTCRRCGKKSCPYSDFCNGTHAMHILPWNSVAVHSTSIGTLFSGGRMSISFPAAYITPIITTSPQW
jgi:sulfatase maturation enzyme AslB (radical SAM superfamily)